MALVVGTSVPHSSVPVPELEATQVGRGWESIFSLHPKEWARLWWEKATSSLPPALTHGLTVN